MSSICNGSVAFIIRGMHRNTVYKTSVRRFLPRDDNSTYHIFFYLKNISSKTAEQILKDFDKKKFTLSVTNSSKFDKQPLNPQCFPDKWQGSYRVAPINYWDTMHSTSDMMLNHERKYNMRFDSIFFTRPDFEFTTPFDICSLQRGVCHWKYDQFLVFDRSDLKILRFVNDILKPHPEEHYCIKTSNCPQCCFS